MKIASTFAPWVLAGAATFALLTACSSQAQSERSAARQRMPTTTTSASSVAAKPASTAASSSIQLVQAAGPAPQETDANLEAGKETFEQCAICHNIDTDEAKMGPSLKGLFKKEKLASGKAVSEETVRAVINEGGNGMPGYEDLLEADEMKNLMAYLRTL